jgi:hypothetical protein
VTGAHVIALAHSPETRRFLPHARDIFCITAATVGARRRLASGRSFRLFGAEEAMLARWGESGTVLYGEPTQRPIVAAATHLRHHAHRFLSKV